MSGPKKWKTAGGVVVIQRGHGVLARNRRGNLEVKIYAYKLTGGFHGLLWLRNLTPVKS